MYSSARRVAVTGGAGFLGSHLCERLLADGCEVICVDNFHTGSRSNVSHLLPSGGFTVLEHDVTAPLYVQVEVPCPQPLLLQHVPTWEHGFHAALQQVARLRVQSLSQVRVPPA